MQATTFKKCINQIDISGYENHTMRKRTQESFSNGTMDKTPLTCCIEGNERAEHVMLAVHTGCDIILYHGEECTDNGSLLKRCKYHDLSLGSNTDLKIAFNSDWPCQITHTCCLLSLRWLVRASLMQLSPVMTISFPATLLLQRE